MAGKVNPWDEFEAPGGRFMKWREVGDSISGTITEIKAGTNFDGEKVPELHLDVEDGPSVVSVAQANLFAQIRELEPKVGDSITIKYAKDEKAALGTKKVFEVSVNGSDEPPF